MLGFVDGYAHEPRLQAIGFPQRPELPPGHGPCRLYGIVGSGLVAGDEGADTAHLLVVRSHDLAERELVTGSG